MKENSDSDNSKFGKLTKIVRNHSSFEQLDNFFKKTQLFFGHSISQINIFFVKRWNNLSKVKIPVICWVLAVSLLLALTGIQIASYRSSFTSVTSADGGTYAEGVLGQINSLNPIFASSNAEQDLSRLVFSSLLKDDLSGHLNYNTASKISLQNNGCRYIVSVRNDIYWHDGQKLTADDVVYTIGLIKDPTVGSTITGWEDVKVSKIDDYTVAFDIPNPYAAFKNLLTFPILPKHLLNTIQPSDIRSSDFSSHPVGSGPYIFHYYQPSVNGSGDHKIVYLQKNKNYYKRSAKIDNFLLNSYNTEKEISQAIDNNEIDAAADLGNFDVKKVKQSEGDGVNVETSSINSGVYAIFNIKSDILVDSNVRKAIQAGTDTSELRKQLDGNFKSLCLPFISSQVGSNLQCPSYNPGEANSLLEKSGWMLENGVRKKNNRALELSVVTTKNNDNNETVSALAKQWQKLGIKTDIKIIDAQDINQNFVQGYLQPRNYDVLIYQLDIGSDPDVYAYWHSSQVGLSGYNFSNYSNPIADDTLLSAREESDNSLRDAKYNLFAKQWLNDVPAVGLYQASTYYVYSNNVKPYNRNNYLVSSFDRYVDIANWSVNSRTVYKTP